MGGFQGIKIMVKIMVGKKYLLERGSDLIVIVAVCWEPEGEEVGYAESEEVGQRPPLG